MTANTSPIFTLTPNTGFGSVQTANTAMDGTGTVVTVFTAGASGSFVSTIFVKPTGSCAASVIRIWLNNGSTNVTATNNCLLFDYSLPQTTASNVTALAGYEIPFNKQLPAGYKLNITIGTTVSATWAVTVYGGDY